MPEGLFGLLLTFMLLKKQLSEGAGGIFVYFLVFPLAVLFTTSVCVNQSGLGFRAERIN